MALLFQVKHPRNPSRWIRVGSAAVTCLFACCIMASGTSPSVRALSPRGPFSEASLPLKDPVTAGSRKSGDQPATQPPKTTASTNAPAIKPAKFNITGYGILGNRELEATLRALELGKTKPQYFDATFIENAALILSSHVRRDGFLQPEILVGMTLQDGRNMNVRERDLLERPLPRPLNVTRADFRINKGRRYFVHSLEFEGLETLKEKQARSFFMETDTLLRLKRNRIFTTNRLERGISGLTDLLERRGNQEAQVQLSHLQLDDRTGAVRTRIRVQEGPQHIVKSVRIQYEHTDPHPQTNDLSQFPPLNDQLSLSGTNTVFPDKPYSKLWLQDFTLVLKTNLYALGYPDATVAIRILPPPVGTTSTPVLRSFSEGGSSPSTPLPISQPSSILLDLLAVVRTGPRVHVGQVEFTGQNHTRISLLEQRVPLDDGDPLDPIKAEEGRTRLNRLGVFRNVGLRYDVVDEDTRDVIYEVEEDKRFNLSLLFGWGSYEMARGGVVVDALNIWGRAHSARLTAIQSLKSSRGEFTYTVPAVMSTDVDLFLEGSGLRREEVDFTRVEYGGGIGVHRFFKPIATDVTVRYNYEILDAQNTIPAVASEGLISPAVGSFIIDLRIDRRDNPLYPRRGFKIFSTVETAFEQIGGDANYNRLEIFPSWHKSLGSGLYLGLGIHHGIAVSFGAVSENLPFNRRFFPGGDHSIRGYQEGEASPRNQEGKFVGAETYLLGTVELEQALTPTWSVVLFADSLGYARRLDNYPFDTGLFSAGGGIRWKTLIGPVRLEYGHNINPREGDPSGTLHLSLGHPF